MRRGISVLRRSFSTKFVPGYHFAGFEQKAPRVLVTGAVGQIGTELVSLLRQRYGVDNVIASDVQRPHKDYPTGPFHFLDVEQPDALNRLIFDNDVKWVVHLASLLSATGERNPQMAMRLNTRGIENVLECARKYNLRVFAPSTIAVFGPSTPRDNTPDLTIMRPTTMYGVTKVYLELLGEYYNQKFGVDFRSLRYPGIISNVAMPGGGTTDYAVEIYHEAVKNKRYECFLKPHSRMPMLYMPDCLDATVDLLCADPKLLKQRVYNVTALSFTPAELAVAIKRRIPQFEMSYQPDPLRQAIADSWPASLDDSKARVDWAWKPKYDVEKMTDDMLNALSKKYNQPLPKF